MLHAWCWAHIHRKFLKAGNAVSTLPARSQAGVDRIEELYLHICSPAREVLTIVQRQSEELTRFLDNPEIPSTDASGRMSDGRTPMAVGPGRAVG